MSADPRPAPPGGPSFPQAAASSASQSQTSNPRQIPAKGRGGRGRGRGRAQGQSVLSPDAPAFDPSTPAHDAPPPLPQQAPPRRGRGGRGRSGGGGAGGGGGRSPSIQQPAPALTPTSPPPQVQIYRNTARHRDRIDEDGANLALRAAGPIKKKAANLTSFGADEEESPSPSLAPDEEVKEDFSAGDISKRQKLSQKLSEGQSDLSQRLISQLLGDSYECMVCVDRLGRKAAVWGCGHCYHLFHIGCIKKWRKSSLADGVEWKCPACRTSYKDFPRPSCFCGKTEAPEFNAYFVPHSCGEVCGRSRANGCPHTCQLLCHPGPCPDCTAMGPVKRCFCGRSTYQKLCGADDPGQSCGKPCDKPLPCKKHKCPAPCHSGPCKPCPVTIPSKCYCGRTDRALPCGWEGEVDSTHGPADVRLFSCGGACDLPLPCGHRCAEKCHPARVGTEPCPPCPLSPELVKTCGCGKKRSSEFPPRASCADPLPLCGAPCGRLKPCGKHRCPLPCHAGPCPAACAEEVELQCRCGNPRGTAKMKCSDAQALKDPVMCSRVCKTLRDCGKHQCGVRCCPVVRNIEDPDGLHICKTTCGKPLNCGKHFCSLMCHKGRCNPCLEATFEDKVCPCGKTVHYAPIPCGAEPPGCAHPCSIKPRCGHPPVEHRCHWQGPCPPCPTLIARRCACGQMLLKVIPCSQSEVLCGRVCSRRLHCGEHMCSRKCHSAPCELPVNPAEALAPTTPDPALKPSCGQKCNRRLAGCRHYCTLPCHPGAPCPTTKCQQKQRIFCKCGRMTETVACTGLEEKFLPCDEVCLKQIRQHKLAEALGIASSVAPPSYSDLLINMYRATPRFIENLEATFSQFLRSPSIKLQLPTMDTVQRKIVHELARYYLLDHESIGREPHRYIQLTKKPGARPPTVALSQYAAIHDSVTLPLPGELAPSQQVKKPTLPRPSPSAQHTLHIYELSTKVSSTHLHDFLRPFEGHFTLQWVDDENALVIFPDSATMYKALGALNGGMFRIKQYQDANPQAPQGAGGSLVLGTVAPDPRYQDAEFRLAISRRGAPAPQLIDPPPSPAPNRFGALDEDNQDLWRQFDAAQSEEDPRPAPSAPAPAPSQPSPASPSPPAPIPSVPSWEDLAESVLGDES